MDTVKLGRYERILLTINVTGVPEDVERLEYRLGFGTWKLLPETHQVLVNGPQFVPADGDTLESTLIPRDAAVWVRASDTPEVLAGCVGVVEIG